MNYYWFGRVEREVTAVLSNISNRFIILCFWASVCAGCNSRFVPSAPVEVYGAGFGISSKSVKKSNPVLSVQEGVVKEATGRYANLSLVEPDDVLVSRAHMRQFKVHDGEITELQIARRGRFAISAGSDGRVVISKILANNNFPDNLGDKFSIETEVLLSSPKPILSMSLSPSDRFLAVSWFSYVLIYDLEQNAPVAEMTRVLGRIISMQWDPREELLLMGLASGDVYVWNFVSRKNSLDEVESYIAGIAPIVGVAFHPLGRSFFSIEEDGNVSLWRLLRTEEEIGLRETKLFADSNPQGKTRQDTSVPSTRILDVLLDSAGKYLYLAAEDGRVRILKVRGLKPDSTIEAASEAVLSMTTLTHPSLPGAELLVTSTRDQRLKFWCNNHLLVFESELLKEPFTFVRSSRDVPVLWGAQKNGNLIVTDIRAAEAKLIVKKKLQSCVN